MTMNPKERLLGAVADLQRFVIHHPDEAKCPVCPRWDELQGAAMQAVTAIDDHEAELAALRAELAVLRNNQLGPVPEGPLKALGAWVADHTDDDTWPTAERLLNAALAEMEALRAERAITASPWRYKEWGGLVVGGGEGSAEVLICTMATNTRHDEGRHNRELIVEAPTLRARLDKAEAEAARLRAALRELGKHPEECDDESGACVSHLAYEDCKAELVAAKALLQSGADVVTRGAQIMTLEQLSTWEGCRGFVEAVFEMCERAALGER